ncbi:unnamed protein product [Auanema sp. JU1783]|nr:unnamed protein product [Auanema sp. JU1783]
MERISYLTLFFLLPLLTALSCSDYYNCESCSGALVSGKKCRWCMSKNQCVSSKYLCHPSKSILSTVNCPFDQAIAPQYSDEFSRSKVIYYILATNRIHNSENPHAVKSCLDKVNENIEVIAEISIKTFFGAHTLASLVAVNHWNRQIIVCFQATVGPIQFVTQAIQFITGMYVDTGFGGKMVRYYHEAYKTFVESGIDTNLQKAFEKYPTYQVLTCGHSLGGTMASIFSVHIKQKYGRDVVEYGFSGPRAGDETFAKLHNSLIHQAFRVIRNGDWVPDFPFRISERLTAPYHTKYEVFYNSHMTNETFKICNQADSEECNRGSWLRKLTSHMYMFDQTMVTFSLGLCD